jgi:hypothetical protein
MDAQFLLKKLKKAGTKKDNLTVDVNQNIIRKSRIKSKKVQQLNCLHFSRYTFYVGLLIHKNILTQHSTQVVIRYIVRVTIMSFPHAVFFVFLSNVNK